MGYCTYCGQPAGFLRRKHSKCEEEAQEQEFAIQKEIREREFAIQNAKKQIQTEAVFAMKGETSISNLEFKIVEIEKASGLTFADRKPNLIEAWENAVADFLEDGILCLEEEKRLLDFANHFNLTQDELDRNGAFTKTVKAAVLREVLQGKLPQRISVEPSFPINFQKGESIVWIFLGTKYLEDKVRRQIKGNSQGVSLRVMSGVYFRLGQFKGQTIETTQRLHVDTGIVAVTNKAIYFAGPAKSLRVPYTKIVSFEPFSDGIGITRDATTAKPQIFVTGDGWFTYNLLTNLSQL